jgi:hypothetical protein
MNLTTRLNRLEAISGRFMTPAECQAAADRYSAAYDDAAGRFSSAITPAAFVTAITTTRSPFQQLLLACCLLGDDDI